LLPWFSIQSRRVWHPLNLFYFSVITAVLRGSLESVLFGRSWSTFVILSYTAFYYQVGWFYTLLIGRSFGLPWHRVQNVILPGIFLGILPPLTDGILSGLSGTAGSGRYLYITDFGEPVWWFWDTARNFPPGEALSLWGAVILAPVYGLWARGRRNAGLKSSSGRHLFVNNLLSVSGISTALAVMAAGWGFFQIQIILIPSSLFWLIGEQSGARSLVYNSINLPYWTAAAQAVVGMVCWLLLRLPLLKLLWKRSLHALPFLLLVLLGGRAAGGQWLDLLLPGVSIWLVILILLIQNDWFDRKLDGEETIVLREDVVLGNIWFGILAACLVMVNAAWTLPVLLFYCLGVLYNYPFYRARNYAWGGMKIEGLWAFSALLAGIQAAGPALPLPSALVVLLALVFGGFSLFSVFKDYKDLDAEKKRGVRSLYTILPWSARSIHEALVSAMALGLLAGPVWLAGQNLLLPALVQTAAGVLVLLSLGKARHFRLFLWSISLYLTCLVIWIPSLAGSQVPGSMP
jgi:4-hydroxybenzoate polyprenyltransferase